MTQTTYLHFTKEELTTLNALLFATIVTGMVKEQNTHLQALSEKIYDRIAEMNDPAIQARYQAYRDAVVTSEGSIECDDGALVSEGDDPGAYVMTWTWVTNDQAGIEDEDKMCSICGEPVGKKPFSDWLSHSDLCAECDVPKQ